MGSLQMHRQTQHIVVWGYQDRTPPLVCPSLQVIFTKDAGRDLVPGGGVLGEVADLNQPLDPFFTPPRAGHTCDPRGGYPTPS